MAAIEQGIAAAQNEEEAMAATQAIVARGDVADDAPGNNRTVHGTPIGTESPHPYPDDGDGNNRTVQGTPAEVVTPPPPEE